MTPTVATTNASDGSLRNDNSTAVGQRGSWLSKTNGALSGHAPTSVALDGGDNSLVSMRSLYMIKPRLNRMKAGDGQISGPSAAGSACGGDAVDGMIRVRTSDHHPYLPGSTPGIPFRSSHAISDRPGPQAFVSAARPQPTAI
ncbi:hypothetical protein [Salinisphaera sp. T31B1]|uniref:hypothetical protein n=1 Tax=Salinisphaera sp. T31B1 TaxID=727963 RepID=UPI00333FCE7C